MAALIYGRRILSLKNNLFKTPRRTETGYIVLLPEIGEDLPGKNPLLKEESLLPEFNSLTIEKCIAAIGKQTVEFEQGINSLENHITKSENVHIVNDVLEPIEKLEIPLQTIWGISKVLYFGNHSLMPTKSYFNIHNRAWLAISYKYNSKTIYECCKKSINEKGLTEEQSRIISKYLLEGRLNGLDLDSKKKELLDYYVKQSSKQTEEFRLKVQRATSIFKHKVTDPHKMKGFPVDFLKSVAVDPAQYEVGPWILTLQPPVVQTVLEYCPDSLLRWNIWNANNLICSGYREDELRTGPLVNGITADKISIAKVLGFKHYSDMCMITKMAESLENVHKFLDNLLSAAFPSQEQEINELAAFAKERGFEDKLEQWDIAFWARKHKRFLYNYDEEMLKEYFPLSKVMEGLFQFLKKMFNVEIVERNNIDVWHKDVRFFDVYDLDVSTTEPVGSFYFDPYTRTDQKISINRHSGYVILLRNKSSVSGIKPLSAMIYNFQLEKNNEPCLLTLGNVQSVFENFGRMLQQLLTRVHSIEVAGLSNVEWDATNTSKHFLAHWLYEPEILKSISSHCVTGEPLDDETIENLRKLRSHMIGFNICKELYLSRFDLDLHSLPKIWERIMKDLWPKHFVFKEDKKDSHVCSWTSLFIDNVGGSYYCDLWSKMLAADCFSAFQETESKDDIQKIGKRFKETFLVLGGSVHSAEVFRRFRGRDPSLKAFIKSLNFKQAKQTE